MGLQYSTTVQVNTRIVLLLVLLLFAKYMNVVQIENKSTYKIKKKKI